jgi:hypothetical protein
MLPTTARGEDVIALLDFAGFFLAFTLFHFFSLSVCGYLCLPTSKHLTPDVITCYSIILHNLKKKEEKFKRGDKRELRKEEV